MPAPSTKPVLFVTGHAPPERVNAFRLLHESEDVEFALFGGPLKHGTSPPEDGPTPPGGGPTSSPGHPDRAPGPPGVSAPELLFPHRHVPQHELLALAASGRYRAVVLSTGGRVALPAAWSGARRGGVPVILWSALWAHPRSPAHALSYLALRRLYRSADAVVTYGPHVSAYVRARGARNVHVAPQAVDNDFWGGPPTALPEGLGWPAETRVRFLFAGRPSREKGPGVLIEAWQTSGLSAPSAALVLVGVGSSPPWVPAGGAVRADIKLLDPVPPGQLRNFYGAADVLVVPSIPTSTFREPWGLVANEAMNQHVPVIATDAVGAAAGGLVRDHHNGLVVPAGDPRALADALVRLAGDEPLRARLGEAAAQDVRAYTAEAWAAGFSHALASLGLSRGRW